MGEMNANPGTCVRCIKAAVLLAEWAGKQGHDHCWYYPDVFRRLAEVLGVDVSGPADLPPRHEFEQGCVRFQNEEYGRR